MGVEGEFREPIEGDYIETMDGLLFSVKGLNHPRDLVIAYLRYIPDHDGDRMRGDRRYRRVYDLDETDELLLRRFPQYLNRIEEKALTLQSVPRGHIYRVYSPSERLRALMDKPGSELEEAIAVFVSTLSSESGVPLSGFGVSGSVLIGLAGPASDIDVVVYGLDDGRKAYDALRRLRESSGWIRPYDSETVRGVVKSRWGDTGLDLKKFSHSEVSKLLHGLVGGRDYFIRLVMRRHEFEEERTSRPLRRAVLRAEIVDAGHSIFTPCIYQVRGCSYKNHAPGPAVTQLVSYRGKFTEQAREGDKVEARGTVEEVMYEDRAVYRLMMGGKGDYLVTARSLDR
jgi:hypothetical protein